MANPDEEEFSVHIGNLSSNVSWGVIKTTLIKFFKNIGIQVAKSDIDLHQANKTKNIYGYIYLANGYEYNHILDFFKQHKNQFFPELEKIVKDDKNISVTPKRTQSLSRSRSRSRPRNQQSKSRNRTPRDQSASRTPSCSSREDDSKSQSTPGSTLVNFTVKLPTFGSGPRQFSSKKNIQQVVYIYGQVIGTENRVLEFKEGGGRYVKNVLKQHTGKYMVSFLNSKGGTLLVGVNDSGEVAGVHLNQKEEDAARLQIDEALKGIKPEVFPQMYTVHFIPVRKGGDDLLKVIEIQIEEGHNSQLYEDIYGSVYIRRDGSVQGPLKASQIQEWTRMTLGRETKERDTEIQSLREKERELTELIKVKDIKEKELNAKIRKLNRPKSQICAIM